MSVRQNKNAKWVVETYDKATGKKTYVRPSDYGEDPPQNRRQAKALERKALEARDRRRPGSRDETVGSFAARWMRDYSSSRGESTQIHYLERAKAFASVHGDRPLRTITRDDARQWANQHPSTAQVLRTMFSDALEDKLCDDNPFSRLGLAQSKGREHITVLTPAEVDHLAELALETHGPGFGREMAAFIVWQAYTCMRPGESFAARFSLLDGDTYHLRQQYNSRLRREAAPKHGGVGEIYVPEPAQQAVRDKPRVLGEDLVFHGKRGRQLRQQAMERYWGPVRAAFMAALPKGHHLHERLALDPHDRFDLYELRHMGASFMLNNLGLEPWVIALQLRHSDGGALVIQRYGHPTRATAIDRMRKAFTASGPARIETVRESRAKEQNA